MPWPGLYRHHHGAALIPPRMETGRDERVTPAMEAGLADHVWTIGELLAA